MNRCLTAFAVAGLLTLIVSLAGCSNQGPVDLLRAESLSLSLPAVLEAWPTEPGDDYWADTQMDDGRAALLHVSERGGDGANARAVTGWRMLPFPPPSVRSACAALLEFIAVNKQAASAGANGAAATRTCATGLEKGADASRSWPIDLDDGSPAQLTVTVRSLPDQGDFWFSIAVNEQ